MSKRTSRTSLKAHNTTLKQRLYLMKRDERERLSKVERREQLAYKVENTWVWKAYSGLNRLFKFNRAAL